MGIKRKTRDGASGGLHRLLAVLALFMAFALVAAACGGDDGGDAGATDGDTTDGDDGDTTDGDTGGDDPFAGCGDGASTDPGNMTVGRDVARCDSGFPAAIPLAERETIRMSSSFRLEFIAPILLADAYGEFEAENLDFEFVDLGFSDALPQLGTGEIDLAVGGTEAGFFNGIDNGFDVRWVSGNFFPPNAGDATVPQTGLWARADVFTDPENPDLSELAGTTLASAVGLSSVIAYPIAEAFASVDLVLGVDLDVQTIPSAEMELALENDAVQSAWMLDPLWGSLAGNPDYVLVATQPAGEPIGGLYAGPGCHTDKRDACVAFHRAIIRTINTYLNGDYHQDADVVAEIAEAISQEADAIAATPSLLFDWEIRSGTAERAQNAFISFTAAGEPVVEFSEPFPEDQVVDRSIYLDAVGQG